MSKVKVKLPLPSHEDAEGGGWGWDRILGFHPSSDIRHNHDGKDVSCTYRLRITPSESFWYSFPLGAEWISGLQNEERRNWSLVNVTSPSFLWRSA
jgi:hypothetical protein